jgi:aspartyl-tRNA(Asn)/glutamyl-tRNA(Gln) amidotransferase subunit A
LRRIDRWESSIRAWVSVDRQGARTAAEEATRCYERGESQGPLAGIPLGMKDIVDLAGMRTGAGSPLRDSHCAAADAPVVTRLRQAGAIILGKTVTTEFACFDPPVTCNPWNLSRSPGGSSSGSAAAVAMGMCVASIGTQTGGSIIRPASFCGIAGFKPTHGLVDTAGVVPISERLDHVGPMGRYVADLAELFGVIARPAAALSASRAARVAGAWRGATIRGYFGPLASQETSAAWESALDKLSARGVPLEELVLPSAFEHVAEMHLRIMAGDMAQAHRAPFTANRPAYGPRVSELIDRGLNLSASDYEQAVRHHRQFQDEIDAWLPVDAILLLPSTVTTAPDRSSTGNPLFNAPWSYTGMPSITVPIGLAADGLPCGLQLVASRNHDWQLLAAAQEAEQILQFGERPPLAAAEFQGGDN